ncbi:MAG: HlyD family efflux transporter periplasmic adaptor subunit, partial [Chitinophagales bacterium]|nr:HlyD family efflux transporter periplasmic adaptor subunit [Hyphomicrobiales bacterium]
MIDLLRMDASHSAELRKYEAQKNSISAAKAVLAGHAADYKSGRIRQLEARLNEANATIQAARSRYREGEAAYLRAKDLSTRGIQTAALFEKAQSNYETSQKDIEVAEQKVAYLNVELESARNGTFLGDSYNDAPYSTQRIRELDLRLDEIDAELDYLQERQKQLQGQINEENIRLSRMTGAEIASPASGLVWDYRAESGETVQRGQELLRVVDCDTVIVSASVSERLYNRLKTGDAAQFRLLGENVVYNATITRLAGSGAQTRYENFAIGATPEHLTRYDVTLSSSSFREKGGLDCAVGR